MGLIKETNAINKRDKIGRKVANRRENQNLDQNATLDMCPANVNFFGFITRRELYFNKFTNIYHFWTRTWFLARSSCDSFISNLRKTQGAECLHQSPSIEVFACVIKRCMQIELKANSFVLFCFRCYRRRYFSENNKNNTSN